MLPVSCNRAGVRCDVEVVGVAIVPNQRLSLTFPFVRCPVLPMELYGCGMECRNRHEFNQLKKQKCKDQIKLYITDDVRSLRVVVGDIFDVSASSGSIKNSL